MAIKAQSAQKYLSFVMFDANLTINQLRNAHHDVKLEEDRPLYGQERLLQRMYCTSAVNQTDPHH